MFKFFLVSLPQMAVITFEILRHFGEVARAQSIYTNDAANPSHTFFLSLLLLTCRLRRSLCFIGLVERGCVLCTSEF